MDAMNKQYTFLRIWRETWKRLRLLSELVGKSQIRVVDELVTAELKRLSQGAHEATAPKAALTKQEEMGE